MLTKLGFKVLVVLAVTTLAGYFGIRIYYYFALGYGVIDRMLALALLAGEGHAIQHAFGFMLGVFKLQLPRRSIKKAKLRSDRLPSVAVLVPIRDEPREVVEQTLITLFSLDYANKHIYVLDGSRKPVCVRHDRFEARRYPFSYFHSSKPSHSKAQTINRYLHRFKEKYLVIFDVDQNPLAEFITETVKVAEADDNIAFVQTPQLYSNIDVSPIAKGAAMQQSIFYESICEAKGSENAMFCCGTNVLIRTDVLKEV
ncbi:MAG: glycosyltransferase, partial [Patescibacteria group bacterium]